MLPKLVEVNIRKRNVVECSKQNAIQGNCSIWFNNVVTSRKRSKKLKTKARLLFLIIIIILREMFRERNFWGNLFLVHYLGYCLVLDCLSMTTNAHASNPVAYCIVVLMLFFNTLKINRLFYLGTFGTCVYILYKLVVLLNDAYSHWRLLR